MATTTRNIIQSETLAVGVLTAAFAAFLVVYAALFGVPAWTFADAEPRYMKVAKGKVGDVVQLDALTQKLRASPWRSDMSRAAFVQMLAAQESGLDTARAETRLTAARRDLRLGLEASPSDAYAWTRLALSEQRLQHLKQAAAALSIALQISPAERRLTPVQLDLAIIVWHELDVPAREALERRLVWAVGKGNLPAAANGNSARALTERLKSWRAETQDQK